MSEEYSSEPRRPGRPRKNAPAPLPYGREIVGSFERFAPFIAHLGDDEGRNRVGFRSLAWWQRTWTLPDSARRAAIALTGVR